MSHLRCPNPPTWQILILLLAIIAFYGVAHPADFNLTWLDNSNNEDGFKIERRLGQTAFAQITTVGVNISSYINSGLSDGTMYCYRVRAFNANGDSAYSNEACGTTPSTPSAQTLTVTKTGIGSGTVTSSSPGIDCGLDCSESYSSGTAVTLTAIPGTDSAFSGWSGACNGLGPCTITMTEAQSVTAAFDLLTYTLSINVVESISSEGIGSGTVISTPPGIDCGVDCSESFPIGTAVTLTAISAANSVFAGWSGACSGLGGCSVTLDANRSATATFTGGTFYTLTAAIAGSGHVQSDPQGIDCGADCSEAYPSGTSVTLNPIPAAGYKFDGWSVAGCVGMQSCTMVLTNDISVVANFVQVVFSKIGVFRPSTGEYLIDLNGNGLFDGCEVDTCFSPPSGNSNPGNKKGNKPGNGNQSNDQPVIAGDWNFAGTAIIGSFDPDSGFWQLDNGNNQWDGCEVDTCIDSFGQPGDLPVTGDWDGTETIKIGLFRPSTGEWLLDFNGNNVWDGCEVDRCLGPFGQEGDLPIVGKWCSNCATDSSNENSLIENSEPPIVSRVGVFRPSTGEYLLDLNGNGLFDGCEVDTCFSPPSGNSNPGNKKGNKPGNGNQSNDQPVIAGDWNFAGTAIIGSFDPDSGFWQLDNGNNQWDGCEVDTCIDSFGQPGDLPVTGDWDGTETIKIGLFRPSTGEWLLDLNGNNVWDGCQVDRCLGPFGQEGDLPAVGKW